MQPTVNVSRYIAGHNPLSTAAEESRPQEVESIPVTARQPLSTCVPEFPHLTLSKNNDALKEKFFTEPVVWVQALVGHLAEVQSNDELYAIMQYTRQCLSYMTVSPENLQLVRDTFEACRLQFEPALKHWTSIDCVRWPHQDQNSCFQSFMGHIFFPVQYESSHGDLYRSEHIQNLLSFSSFYDNTLAQYELIKGLAMYLDFVADARSENGDRSDNEDESSNCEEGAGLQSTILAQYPALFDRNERYLHLLETYKKMPSPDKNNFPCFLRGSLWGFFGGRAYYKMGMEYDPRCAWSYFLSIRHTGDGDEQAHLGKIISEQHPTLSNRIKAHLANEDQIQINCFLAAVADGHTSGLMTVASLAETNDEKYKYYLLAAMNHHLDAYSCLAKLLRKEGNIEEAKVAYLLQAERGDLYGYTELADLIRKSDRGDDERVAEMADEYYIRGRSFYKVSLSSERKAEIKALDNNRIHFLLANWMGKEWLC